MQDFFNLIISLFSDIISCFDSFIIIGNISFLKLFFILTLFSIAIKFLFNNKKE